MKKLKGIIYVRVKNKLNPPFVRLTIIVIESSYHLGAHLKDQQRKKGYLKILSSLF